MGEAPFVVFWPGAVALGIILNSPSSRIGHVSVSGQYIKINRQRAAQCVFFRVPDAAPILLVL